MSIVSEMQRDLALLQLEDTPHGRIERLDVNGIVIETFESPSLARLRQLHNEHRCDAMCSFCYAEACDSKERFGV